MSSFVLAMSWVRFRNICAARFNPPEPPPALRAGQPVHEDRQMAMNCDDGGNVISDAVWSCIRAAEKRLIAMPLLRVEFAYDSQSRRHDKRVLIRPAALAGASARPEKWLLARATRFW